MPEFQMKSGEQRPPPEQVPDVVECRPAPETQFHWTVRPTVMVVLVVPLATS